MCIEGLTWRQLHHPNIVEFLGVFREKNQGRERLAFISARKESDLHAFIRSDDYNPHKDRKRLVSVFAACAGNVSLTRSVPQLTEVGNALLYLHQQEISHGDVSLVSSALC
jgi:serine/threonine protein kinase